MKWVHDSNKPQVWSPAPGFNIIIHQFNFIIFYQGIIHLFQNSVESCSQISVFNVITVIECEQLLRKAYRFCVGSLEDKRWCGCSICLSWWSLFEKSLPDFILSFPLIMCSISVVLHCVMQWLLFEEPARRPALEVGVAGKLMEWRSHHPRRLVQWRQPRQVQRCGTTRMPLKR